MVAPLDEYDSLESEDALPHGAAPARLEAEYVLVGAVPPEALERPHVLPAPPVEHEVRGGDLQSVQQSHFGSRLAFRHFSLRIEIKIGAQMRLTVILHLKPILNTSKLKIEMQIEMKWYIFLSLQQLRQIATLKHKLRCETGLLNSCLDGALAGDAAALVDHGDDEGVWVAVVDVAPLVRDADAVAVAHHGRSPSRRHIGEQLQLL